ncbi:hypothetical protein EC988_008078, partial [Linderina pennispora]
MIDIAHQLKKISLADHPTPLSAAASASGPPKKKPRPPASYCAYHKQYGHDTVDCIAKQRRDQVASSELTDKDQGQRAGNTKDIRIKSKGTDITCFSCGEIGHISTDCPNKPTKARRIIARQLQEDERIISIMANGLQVSAFVDTGADVSVISLELVEELQVQVQTTMAKPQTANPGELLKIIGQAEISLSTKSHSVTATLLVAPTMDTTAIILGYPEIKSLNINISTHQYFYPDDVASSHNQDVDQEVPCITSETSGAVPAMSQKQFDEYIHKALQDN